MDLALPVADIQQANLIVSVGFHATLREFLARERSAVSPYTFLTRLRLGDKLVDGVAWLRRGAGATGVGMLLVLPVVMGIGVALAIFAAGLESLAMLSDPGRSVLALLHGLFS